MKELKEKQKDLSLEEFFIKISKEHNETLKEDTNKELEAESGDIDTIYR